MATLRTADFDYPLPERLIARRPAARRDGSRLLVVPRDGGAFSDRRFAELPRLLAPGDALVLNDTRVFPARLLGRKPTGARVEVFLLRPLGNGSGEAWRWQALVRPGGKLKPGRRVLVGEDLEIEVLGSTPEGGRIVRLQGDGDPWELIERHGRVPLPPYIGRESDERDGERYQTVYARCRGSVAAPTAGLHFTRSLLRAVRRSGVRLVRVTLHVGLGTFRPVEAERPEDHRLDAEPYTILEDAARELNTVREEGGRIWAVGTTACRLLETVADAEGRFQAAAGRTDLFIYPPYRFRAVDGLITNFHLPRSSPLMLVAAFAGPDRVARAYEHAVDRGYRFYSYGDAMLLT
ncbi:MAG: tRNA preQ1(34) S-adenosylmethionine ribosyltransferase-isomerase QueA [Gemmatimonadota bacterium]